MARFDVYALSDGAVPYVLDVQANLLGSLKSRVVVPLVPMATAAHEITVRLKPLLEVAGSKYVLMTTDIGTLHTNTLGAPVANLEAAYRDAIIDALDFLFQGF